METPALLFEEPADDSRESFQRERPSPVHPGPFHVGTFGRFRLSVLDRLFGSLDSPPTWLGPGVLTAAAVVGIGICIGGVPIADSPHPLASFVVGLITVLSFVVLIGLAWRVWEQGKQSWESLRRERHVVANVRQHTRAIVAALQGDRRAVVARAEGRPTDEAVRSLGEIIGAEDTLSAIALDEVRQRYVGGDEVRLEDLTATLRHHEDAHLDPLRKLHELALALGFVGTLVGFAVQAFITQHVASAEGAFSHSFLLGIMLKLTTTLVGLLIAAYARALQWRLLQGFEHVLGAVRQWLCFDILPTCDARSRLIVDLGGIFGQTVEEFRGSVQQMSQALGSTLTTAATQAGAALAQSIQSTLDEFTERLRTQVSEPFRLEMGRFQTTVESVGHTVLDEFTERLRTQVSEPFRLEMSRLQTTVESVGHTVLEGASALQTTTARLSSELEHAIRIPGQLTRDLQTAASVMTDVVSQFDRVAQTVDRVGQQLDAAEAQINLSLDTLLGRESQLHAQQQGVLNEARALTHELGATAEEVRTTVDHLTPLVGALARLPHHGPGFVETDNAEA